MQSRVPVKNGDKKLYSAKITRELLLYATATTLTTTTTLCASHHSTISSPFTLAYLVARGMKTFPNSSFGAKHHKSHTSLRRKTYKRTRNFA